MVWTCSEEGHGVHQLQNSEDGATRKEEKRKAKNKVYRFGEGGHAVIVKQRLTVVKRKVDSENRDFQNRWDSECMFTDTAGKHVCLISGANVAVIKEFNLKRNYETKHQEKLKNLNAEQKIQKVEELKKNLTFQQTFFTREQSQSEAGVKTEEKSVTSAGYLLRESF
ncbi:general transcription factor II-I repeat domain-containing protein 2-like [Silurus meridionalis]|nr:general transcription factor II-I repeat domain-containing protein 2-like [Silurus meridionalis]